MTFFINLKLNNVIYTLIIILIIPLSSIINPLIFIFNNYRIKRKLKKHQTKKKIEELIEKNTKFYCENCI